MNVAIPSEFLAIAAAVFTISAFLTSRLVRVVPRRFLLDHPNERSLHDRPTPRSGGLAIAVGTIVGVGGITATTAWPGPLTWLSVGAVIVMVVSFIDDLSHVHPGIRITIHSIVALMLVLTGLRLEFLDLPGLAFPLAPWLATVVTCLYIAWLINLYNFMDGMDGFAAGMAVIGFGTFALLGTMAGDYAFAGVNLVIAASAGGFLMFNFPPARIFMGDVGSSLLGYLAAALSLWAAIDGVFPLWIGALVFSPFIVDATFTLFIRLFRRERFWKAHKTHCYQRLVQLGWGHRKTVLWEYVLMVCCAASALFATHLNTGQQWWLMAIWTLVYTILVSCVYRLDARQGSREYIRSL